MFHEYIPWTMIGSVAGAFSGVGTDSSWFRRRRNRRNSWCFALLAQAVATESRTRRTSDPRTKIRFGTFFRTHAEPIGRTQNHHPTRSHRRRLFDRPLDIAHCCRPHLQKMGRRILSFQRAKNPLRSWLVVPKTRRQIDEALTGDCRSLARTRVAPHQKNSRTSFFTSRNFIMIAAARRSCVGPPFGTPCSGNVFRVRASRLVRVQILSNLLTGVESGGIVLAPHQKRLPSQFCPNFR